MIPDITYLFLSSATLVRQYLDFEFIFGGINLSVKEVFIWSSLAALVIAYLKEAINT